MKSWKTTVGGIALIVSTIANTVRLLVDGDAATNPDWTLVIGALAAGWALIMARDNAVSSEDAGIK